MPGFKVYCIFIESSHIEFLREDRISGVTPKLKVSRFCLQQVPALWTNGGVELLPEL